MATTCDNCNERSKKMNLPCAKFPCRRVSQAELESEGKTTRRARQRATVDDSQMLARTDPADLAAAGYFDR